MAAVLSHKRFWDEEEAYKWVEAHLWPLGPQCPRCGVLGDRITKLQGKSTRIGTYKCKDCRKPFTVKIGTIFEDSHIPMRYWLQAIALLTASKKGISSNQLHRMMGITLKSAWFMSHRIREAMREGKLLPPMGGGGGIVEADETFTGWKKDYPRPLGHTHKFAVLTLVDRKSGQARSFHIDRAEANAIIPIVRENVAREATVATDQARYYLRLKEHVAQHESVNHSVEEWARGEIHTNTVEGYFSVFKRGMRGTYQHCSEKHLHRYLAEFDFRYNNRVGLGVDDHQRAAEALLGVKGKRLTYRASDRTSPKE
jgi:transposase-like protein